MKILTFSYDDGVRQDIRLCEIFRKYGLKATFNLNSGSLGHAGRINHFGFDVCFDKMKPDEIKDLYKPEHGFEVACHGVFHKNLPTLTKEQFYEEIYTDKCELEKLCGNPVTGGAYACGRFDENSDARLKECGIYYYRTILDTHNFSIPQNFNYWHPTCHDNDDKVFELADKFINLDDSKDALFYIWGHAFELDKNDKDRWYNMEKLCEKLAGRNDIVYATNAEAKKLLCENMV